MEKATSPKTRSYKSGHFESRQSLGTVSHDNCFYIKYVAKGAVERTID